MTLLAGRLYIIRGETDTRPPEPWIQTMSVGGSRFHPASVAGLVVGAMGCFIFGLYLRRWLRERKAAA
jgi:hypothetical protein